MQEETLQRDQQSQKYTFMNARTAIADFVEVYFILFSFDSYV